MHLIPLTMRIATAALLLSLAGAIAVACQKEPPPENVRPVDFGGAGVDGTSGTSSGDNGSGSGATSGEGANSGDGDGDGPGDGDGDGEGPGDGDGEGPGDGDGEGPGDGDGEGPGDGDGEGPGDGDGDVDPWPTPAFTKRGLLESTGTCVRLHFEEFLERAEALQDATDAHENDPSEATLEAARNAWLAAFASWQRAEAFRIGPAVKTSEPGGQGLRDEIYAFPHISRCEIDANTVAQTYASGVSSLPANQRGIGAVEYLLFQSTASNECPTPNPINKSGTFAALGTSGVLQRRASYAAKAVDDIVARARTLVNAWDPAQGDYYGTFVEAGDGSAVYATQQAAFQSMNEALYYIELDLKDTKLGVPLEIKDPCGAICFKQLEARFAGVSIEAMQQNLVGVRRFFQGCGPSYSGLGFDDWLIDIGSEELAADMIAALENAQTTFEGVDSLEQAFASDPAQVMALYNVIKGFTDLLKTQFITVLHLDPPPAAGIDTD